MKYISGFLVLCTLIACKVVNIDRTENEALNDYVRNLYSHIKIGQNTWDSLLVYRPFVYPQNRLIDDGKRVFLERADSVSVFSTVEYTYNESSRRLIQIEISLTDKVDINWLKSIYFRKESDRSPVCYKAHCLDYDIIVQENTIRLIKLSDRETY